MSKELESLLHLKEYLKTNPNPSMYDLRVEATSHFYIQGICDWVISAGGSSSRLPFWYWKHWTGDPYFVIDDSSGMPISLQYDAHEEYPFNPNKEYTQLRLQLLDFLIEELSKKEEK